MEHEVLNPRSDTDFLLLIITYFTSISLLCLLHRVENPRSITTHKGMLRMICQIQHKAVSRCPATSVPNKPISPIFFLFRPSSSSSAVQSCSSTLVVDAPPHLNPCLKPSPKLSRNTSTEAQDVLFDYLHHTRNLPFTHAHHISTNSPRFLHNLLSKIHGAGVEVPWLLSKYLRYNPINEFEAFLESLGLNPDEISSLIPGNMIFLNDDRALLESYQALRNYGVPHGAIGRMYKESKEIFGHDYGLLNRKLCGYDELGLSRSCVVKLVSCFPLLLVGEMNADFVAVFEKLKGLGIWESFAGGCLPNKSNCNWKRMRHTLEFLDKVGFSEKQVKSLIQSNPGLVFEGPGKKILVLVGKLLKLGIQQNILSRLCIENPQLLSRKFGKNVLQALRFLSDIGMEAEDISFIVSSHIQLLGSHSYKRPKTVLSRLKIGRNKLCRMLKDDPLKLFSLAAKSNDQELIAVSCHVSSKLQEKMAFLLRLGYIENSDEMSKALKQFRGRGDQLQERFDCLVEAGLDSRVVTYMIKQAPNILNQRKGVLQKKIDCLRNYMGYHLESVAAFPSYLCYDLDRIYLRFSMYSWLRERGAAKPTLSLGTILACSESRFMKYFVEVHPEGRGFWETLKQSAASY